jgi:GDPmannose 4,6-dehydratase
MLRPVESVNLVGNAGKAARLLGWKPEVQFEEIIAKMTEAEMKLPPA